MLLRARFLLLAVLILFAPSGAAFAQDVLAEDGIFDRPICEPPISTCRFGPDIHDSLTSTVPVPQDSCPLGFSCTCVPSCPECDDCDAQVCVPDPSRQCETACDCRPGLGCFDNRWIRTRVLLRLGHLPHQRAVPGAKRGAFALRGSGGSDVSRARREDQPHHREAGSARLQLPHRQ